MYFSTLGVCLCLFLQNEIMLYLLFLLKALLCDHSSMPIRNRGSWVYSRLFIDCWPQPDCLLISLTGQWLLAEHSAQTWATSHSRAYSPASWERRRGCDRQTVLHSCPPLWQIPTQHSHLHPRQGAPSEGATPTASTWSTHLRSAHVCQDSCILREDSRASAGPAGELGFVFWRLLPGLPHALC